MSYANRHTYRHVYENKRLKLFDGKTLSVDFEIKTIQRTQQNTSVFEKEQKTFTYQIRNIEAIRIFFFF